MTIKKRIKITLLITAIIYALSFAFWKQSRDTFYWINASNFADEQDLTILTSHIIYWWRSIFGHEVVHLRLFARFLNIITICIPYFILQSPLQRKTNLHFLALGIIFMGGTIEFIFNDGTTSMLSVVCLTTYCIKTKLQYKKNLVIASILSSISIACRFPNILIVPFIALFIVSSKYDKDELKSKIINIIIYTSLSFGLYLVIICLLKQSFDCFGFALSARDLATSNVNKSHSLLGLLWLNFYLLVESWIEISPILCIMVLSLMLPQKLKESKLTNIFLIFVMIILFAMPQRLGFYGSNSSLLYGNWRYVSIIGISLFTYLAFLERNRDIIIRYIFIISMAFAVTAGSDAGIMKLIYVFSAFSPLAISTLLKYKKNKMLHLSFICTSIIISIIGFNGEIIENRYYANFNNNKWQYTTQGEFESTRVCIEDYENYGEKDQCIFYGIFSHKMYVYTDSKIPINLNFAQLIEDELQIEKIINFLSTNHKYTLFIYYHEIPSSIINKLEGIGYKEYKHSHVARIYKYLKE